MSQQDETYLHDGVYASFDGFQIKLRTPRDGGDHVIYLDGTTLECLETFVRSIRQS